MSWWHFLLLWVAIGIIVSQLREIIYLLRKMVEK